MGKGSTRPRRSSFSEAIGHQDFRAARFDAGAGAYVVMSIPAEAVPAPSLTEAELAVRGAILRGMSNLEIAQARQTSVRTIANQVASILRKHGVGSRAELIAVTILAEQRPGGERE